MAHIRKLAYLAATVVVDSGDLPPSGPARELVAEMSVKIAQDRGTENDRLHAENFVGNIQGALVRLLNKGADVPYYFKPFASGGGVTSAVAQAEHHKVCRMVNPPGATATINETFWGVRKLLENKFSGQPEEALKIATRLRMAKMDDIAKVSEEIVDELAAEREKKRRKLN